MNAQELFLKDGRSSLVFYCSTCRIVHREIEQAEQCCAPYKCQLCGTESQKYYQFCDGCLEKREQQRELDKFNAAEKLATFDGPVYCEGFGTNEGYFDELGDLLDEIADMDGDGIPPKYAWACTVAPIVTLDYSSIIEDATQECYDGFDPDDLVGEKELTAALDAFNELNKERVNWTPDYTRAILLPQPETAPK